MLIQLNIRGLVSKQSDLSRFIQNCTKSSKRIDVVLLCEKWVTRDTQELINIPGYQFIGLERPNKKGGGVSILVTKELKYKIINDLSTMTEHMESFTIELAVKGHNMICSSMY